MTINRTTEFNFTLPRLVALKAGDYSVTDTGQPSLSCRVRKNGIKILQVRKRPKGSHKLVRVKICAVGELPINGENGVRSKARKILSDLERGLNPNEENRKKIAKNKVKGYTLQNALDDYIHEDRIASPDKPSSKGMIKESTATGYRQRIESYLSDWLDLPIESITPDMVEERHKLIAKKLYSAANNSLRTFRRIYNYAAKQTAKQSKNRIVLPPNPTMFMDEVWLEEKRRTGHVKMDDLKIWWEAVESLPDNIANGDLARDYMQFVLLTGLRRREVSDLLLWENIDFKTKSFVVHDTKNKQDHKLPLSDYLVKILKQRLDQHKTKPFPIKEVKQFVSKVADLSGHHYTIHDLRRTFITIAESLDLSSYTIKSLVNHKLPKGDITAGYIQLDVERLRDPMQQITDFILEQANK